jgi:tryptophan synthase alpha chain
MLESYIRERQKAKPLLLMTHIVIGYPDLETSFALVKVMVAAGVDLMELQIPFSEPIADGPVIISANQQALANGVTVAQCLDFGAQAARSLPIPLLFMSYSNILIQFGMDRFARAMAENRMAGAIVPDLPPEEGRDYLRVMRANNLAPIMIVAPTTADDRLRMLAGCGAGFVYCAARKGVTGAKTDFSQDIGAYLARCRQATPLPLALGFGVKDKADCDFLEGKADIAVIGSETLRRVATGGPAEAGRFIRGLLSCSP